MATTRTTGSVQTPISTRVTLASADDLDGTPATFTQCYDVSGASRVIIQQVNDGTNGAVGIDVVEISHDNGETWKADALTVYPIAENDFTGTLCVGGVLNVAGTEPTLEATFKAGPYVGPTWIRIGRKTSTITSMTTYDHTLTAGTTWTGGAPGVYMFTIGQTSGAPTAIA
jgi:hypothetical protein